MKSVLTSCSVALLTMVGAMGLQGTRPPQMAAPAAVTVSMTGWAEAEAGQPGVVSAKAPMASKRKAAKREEMIVTAWNYTPDSSVTPVRGVLRAGFRYRHPPGAWDWSAVYLAFSVDGKDVSDSRAAARLREVPVIDWVNVYSWPTFHSEPPHEFCDESIETTKRLVAEVKERLSRVGMADEQLASLLHVLDIENWEQKQIPSATLGREAPFGVTACYLFTDAMNSCGWKPNEKGGAANYNTSHSGNIIPMGGPPHNRMTPMPVPGSLDGRTTFVSGYLQGGPRGCMNEDEMMDVIAKSPAPLWLALEDNNPGLVRILRAAKASGKVRLVMLWGNGKSNEHTGDTGSRHRENRNGGDRDWMKQQDERIARAIGG